MQQIKLDPSISRHRITVLLIDDQQIIAETVRQLLDGEHDIDFHYCSDPKQAIPIAIAVKPTVILQDLVMPDIEGLTLVRYFRAHPATKQIPLIVLSTKEEPHIKAESFALGANDYIVKLPDKLELVARIRYHSKSYINWIERNEAFEALKSSQNALMSELREAADYVKSLLPPVMNGEVHTNWIYIPSTQLGGDTFGYHWLNEEEFAIYLLDVCGHGVGAALLSVSVMNVLRSQTLPEVDFSNPAQVLTGLNKAFQMERYNNMYFTIWYGVYSKKDRVLTYSSGGHPAALLFNGPSKEDVQVYQLETPSFIIGGMEDTQFKNGSIQLEKYAQLFVFSDGIYELDRPSQGMMGFDDLITVMKEARKQPSVLETLLNSLRTLQQKETFDDDFSIVEFNL